MSTIGSMEVMLTPPPRPGNAALGTLAPRWGPGRLAHTGGPMGPVNPRTKCPGVW